MSATSVGPLGGTSSGPLAVSWAQGQLSAKTTLGRGREWVSGGASAAPPQHVVGGGGRWWGRGQVLPGFPPAVNFSSQSAEVGPASPATFAAHLALPPGTTRLKGRTQRPWGQPHARVAGAGTELSVTGMSNSGWKLAGRAPRKPMPGGSLLEASGRTNRTPNREGGGTAVGLLGAHLPTGFPGAGLPAPPPLS